MKGGTYTLSCGTAKPRVHAVRQGVRSISVLMSYKLWVRSCPRSAFTRLVFTACEYPGPPGARGRAEAFSAWLEHAHVRTGVCHGQCLARSGRARGQPRGERRPSAVWGLDYWLVWRRSERRRGLLRRCRSGACLSCPCPPHGALSVSRTLQHIDKPLRVYVYSYDFECVSLPPFCPPLLSAFVMPDAIRMIAQHHPRGCIDT